MGAPREPTYSLLVVAAFSRHVEALDWAALQLTPQFGALSQISPDYSFHHTKYYEPSMGPQLIKRFLVFEPMASAGCLPEAKHFTIGL
jgi:hypothetical protein